MMMLLRVGLVACVALIMRVTAFHGHIGCDDELTLFVDGTQVAALKTWNKVWEVNQASTPDVIAVKCVNGGGLGGIVADGDLATDTTWHCSDTDAPGWTDASFDESAWAPAVESTNAPSVSSYANMSSSAKFIWSDPESTGTTYCRQQAFRGKIGCDDQLTVYLDGIEVASDTAWDKVNDIVFFGKPAVIAVKCFNDGGPGGIVGSFDGGMVTDPSWRCSGAESSGWTGASFDDSAWASAVVSTNAPPLSAYGGVSSSAKFIWSDAGASGTTYCRLKLQWSVLGEVIQVGVLVPSF